MDQPKKVSLDDIVSLCKRKGFAYQAAEIYGGLNGVYDFGPLGTALKENIRAAWKRAMRTVTDQMFFIEGSLLAPRAVWEASGHISNFHDPMVDCLNCKRRFRADDIDLQKSCPVCGVQQWTAVREFNLMFKTNLGALADQASEAYLRPETAQAIYINFKNVTSSNRTKIPFGIAQVGKSFRNEITPKQFLFRSREFEQMEMQWFCKPEMAAPAFEFWQEQRKKFYQSLGLNQDRLRFRAHGADELSHYSSGTIDVEYEFPFGWKELEGIANRGNFDLTQHTNHSGKELSVFDDETNESYIPHVVECSVGVDRLFLTVLFDAYTIDTIDGEERAVLKLHPSLAPVKAAILPLTKKISEPARVLYEQLRLKYAIQFDEAGSIGKRYRRQDEIGTPLCITFDFDSLEDNCVTIRHRDTTAQERIAIDQVEQYLIDLCE